VGGRPKAGGGGGAERNLQPAAGGVPSTPAGVERIAVEQAKPGSQGASVITDSLYEDYTPQRVRVEGKAIRPPSSKLWLTGSDAYLAIFAPPSVARRTRPEAIVACKAQ
jgi:hypothetical protein